MISTVIFDLDDTLYDEADYCKSGYAAVSRFLSRQNSIETPAVQIKQAMWNQFVSGNRTKIFNDALDKLNISYNDELISKMIEIYRNHNPSITLSKDCRNVLDELSKKYSLALLTDGFLPAQKLKVQALKIKDYFDYIVYTEELGRNCWKPSPVGFEKIIRTLRANPDKTVYVADDEQKDFITPNKLGLISIRLISPAGIHTLNCNKSDFKARYTIKQITELPPLLDIC